MAEPVGGRLSEAFRQTYEAARVSQLDIAAALGVDQPTVSKWARGMRRPPLDALPVTEDVCGVRKGTILRRAGYVEDGCNFRDAVLADPDLSEDDRRTLLGFYDFALSRSATEAR